MHHMCHQENHNNKLENDCYREDSTGDIHVIIQKAKMWKVLFFLSSCVKDDAVMVSGLAWLYAPVGNVHQSIAADVVRVGTGTEE